MLPTITMFNKRSTKGACRLRSADRQFRHPAAGSEDAGTLPASTLWRKLRGTQLSNYLACLAESWSGSCSCLGAALLQLTIFFYAIIFFISFPLAPYDLTQN